MKKQYTFPAIYFEPTRRCNLGCPICMTGCDNMRVVRESVKKELTPEEIIEYILRPARELGVRQIAFSGGEFLLREDAIDILKATADMGYVTGLVTNGSLLTDSLLMELKALLGKKLILVFGLNSLMDNDLNRHSRKMDIDSIVRHLERCKKLRIRRHVVVNINKLNMTELDPLFQWLVDHRLPFNRTPFVPRMSGRAYFREWGFSREDMKNNIFPALVKHMQGYISYTPFFLSPEVHAEASGGGRRNVTVPQNPSIGCWVGSWIGISAEGDVSPCGLLLDTLVAGNLRESSLYDIIDRSDIFQTILNRDKLKGKCGRCRYKFTCGGCRALAYFKSGDYMSEDPTCFFEPVDESTQCEYEELTNRNFKKYLRLAARGGLYTRPGV